MSWLNRLKNHFRQEAQRAVAGVSMSRWGIVQNYDPARYAARVLLMPEEILTGYLPMGSPWVGDEWGFFAGPSVGDAVEVHFQQGSKGAGYIGSRFYTAKSPPVAVPSGEFLLAHQSGSLIHLANDGSVTITANTNMTLNAPNGTFRVAAETIQMHATAVYRFDCYGHGQAWTPTKVDTYQIGEVPGSSNAISPPEIGN
jgi:hypothetical protein